MYWNTTITTNTAMAIQTNIFAISADTNGHSEKSGKNNMLNILSVSRIAVL